MKKRIIGLIILTILILIPSTIFADGIKSIIIIVDEMSLSTAEELSINGSSIGFVNLKTRAQYSEENLYLSINMGRKLGKMDLKKEGNLEFLGDVLRKEKPSYIGMGNEGIILGDSEGRISYEERSISYDIDWLLKNTDLILEKSNILAIGYDFKGQLDRVDILRQYLEYYKDHQIIILPKTISEEDRHILNKSLVPIIHINNGNSGLLTSSSTKRVGFIAMEDISVQLKNSYGYFKKTNIGNNFQTITRKEPIKESNKIYITTMNLLIISYIFHGLTYITQVLLGIWLLKPRRENGWIYFLYIFSVTGVCISLILGLFELHRNIYIYLLVSTLTSYIFAKKVINKKDNLVEGLIILTYGLIVYGVLFYPKMIYNSYIGFNNLVYGARYYGLNNGIMGVLLASSTLSFFSLTKTMNNIYLKKIIGFFIFGLNMIVLSTNFGANTGGFITSVILFVLMMYMLLFSQKHSLKKVIMFLLIGIALFILNMIVDNNSGNKSHAIEFFYRLKENGFREFFYMASFKARELLILTLTPPFSIVLICQGIILKKLSKYFKENEKIKKEAMIIIITSLIGFIINDTGMIMLIYMINYFILYVISNRKLIG